MKDKIVEKLQIKKSTRYTPKKSKQAIPINECVKDIDNDEYVNVIVNNLVNDEYINLNKAWNHTLENDIEKDGSVVTIQSKNKLNVWNFVLKGHMLDQMSKSISSTS